MRYKILAVHQEYSENKLSKLAVQWQSNELGWVRASYSNTTPIGGYKFLLPNDEISMDLIQEVAGSGMNLPDNLKRKYFPGKRNWER